MYLVALLRSGRRRSTVGYEDSGVLAFLLLIRVWVFWTEGDDRAAATHHPLRPDSTADSTPAPAPAPDRAPAPAPTGEAPSKSLLPTGSADCAAITTMVDQLVNDVAADGRINNRFFNTDIVALKKLLTDFVCMATGGPCKYAGRDIKSSARNPPHNRTTTHRKSATPPTAKPNRRATNNAQQRHITDRPKTNRRTHTQTTNHDASTATTAYTTTHHHSKQQASPHKQLPPPP